LKGARPEDIKKLIRGLSAKTVDRRIRELIRGSI